MYCFEGHQTAVCRIKPMYLTERKYDVFLYTVYEPNFSLVRKTNVYERERRFDVFLLVFGPNYSLVHKTNVYEGERKIRRTCSINEICDARHFIGLTQVGSKN